MRKRILPLFLAVLLVLSTVPVWAEDTVCSCDALCTQEAHNGECPVCGGENGDPALCAFHAEGKRPGRLPKRRASAALPAPGTG